MSIRSESSSSTRPREAAPSTVSAATSSAATAAVTVAPAASVDPTTSPRANLAAHQRRVSGNAATPASPPLSPGRDAVYPRPVARAGRLTPGPLSTVHIGDSGGHRNVSPHLRQVHPMWPPWQVHGSLPTSTSPGPSGWPLMHSAGGVTAHPFGVGRSSPITAADASPLRRRAGRHAALRPRGSRR